MGAAFDWVASLYARLSTRPSLRSHRSSARRASRGRSLRDWNRYLLQLERLEDRTVPSITVTGQNLTPSESVPEPLMAATFTDTTPSPVANYNATIDWGDGTLTAGTVTGTAGGPFTVTGTHTYAEDGSDTITVTVTETADDMDTASGTGTATVQEGNFALQGGGTLSATEGVSFSNFVVGTFNDFMPPSPDPASSFTASIDWGDGNTSAGTITGSGGNFTVTGDHTYVEEISGISYAVTVQEPSVNFSIGPNTVGHSVTVADAQISTPSVTPPSNIQEGIPTPADFNIATFNDPAGVGVETASGDFAAAIDWGDGTTDTGTVVSDGNGDYHVNAPAHTYTGENINGESEGDATIAVTVTHDVLAPLTGTATATVGDPNIVATGGVSFSLADSETLTLSGTVATFTDPGNSTNYEDASDYSATIDWGDGVTTPGFIVFGGGTFTVLGNHTYADETIGGVTGGVVNITTRITHESLPTQTAISTATISDPNIVATGGFNFTVTEGSTVSGTVATFTDPANSTNFEDAADYSATIDWGDGTTTDGFIVFGGGTFSVAGSHTYADEVTGGVATITTRITHESLPPQMATSTATVNDADSLTGTATPISSSEGILLTNVQVATFSDTNATAVASDFTAEILWGDGLTTPGTVSGATGGPFTVTGTHNYADEGTFTPTVTLSDDAPSMVSASAVGIATIAESDAITPTPVTITATEGQAFDGMVAQFSDTGYPSNPVPDFTATIDWGDGTTTTGTITGNGFGTFNVAGSHTYADEGTDTVTVVFTDDVPGTVTSTATNTATVSEGDTLTAQSTTLTPTEGATATGTAVFSDSNTSATASDFTATIDWGDGTSSTGTVSGGSGSFTVTGTHTFAAEGSFSATFTLTDDAPGTAVGTASATGTIADPAVSLTPAGGLDLQAGVELGTLFLGTFTDPGGSEPNDGTHYRVDVAWGDGLGNPGAITFSGGTFTINGDHVYIHEGFYKVTLTVHHDAAPDSVKTINVSVADAPVFITSLVARPTAVNTTFSGLIGTFVDYDNSGVSSNFRALVSWGDGTASFATVTETGVDALNHPNFQITGAHVYATAATSSIRVDISDIIGGTTTYQTEGSPAVEITYFFDATTQTYKTIIFTYG